MPTRRTTGKRQRFEIFKRDNFACVYCGSSPDDGVTVLVIDHAVPIAAGGPDSIENLVTACTPCNQGKSDRRLEVRTTRPDADMLYLEAMQEAAELRQYHAALSIKEEALSDVVSALQDVWCDHSGLDWHPDDATVRQWLNRYDPESVEAVMRSTSSAVASGRLRRNAWVPYAWGALRNNAAPPPPAVRQPEPEPAETARLRSHLTNWFGVQYFDEEQLMAAASVVIHFNPEPTTYNEDNPHEWDDWTRFVFEESVKDVVVYALNEVFRADPDVVNAFLDFLQESREE